MKISYMIVLLFSVMLLGIKGKRQEINNQNCKTNNTGGFSLGPIVVHPFGPPINQFMGNRNEDKSLDKNMIYKETKTKFLNDRDNIIYQ